MDLSTVKWPRWGLPCLGRPTGPREGSRSGALRAGRADQTRSCGFRAVPHAWLSFEAGADGKHDTPCLS
jgi:hypothetical protein